MGAPEQALQVSVKHNEDGSLEVRQRVRVKLIGISALPGEATLLITAQQNESQLSLRLGASLVIELPFNFTIGPPPGEPEAGVPYGHA